MGYNQFDMAFIEFGPRPSREPLNPTPAQIAKAQLGAVKPDSRVGQEMIIARNQPLPKGKDVLKAGVKTLAVTAGLGGLVFALTGCGPVIGGDAPTSPTDGGGTAPIPDNFGGQVAECINQNTPPVQPSDVPQPAPGIDPAIFEACKDAVMNQGTTTSPQS
jgi:hypothetical protein